MHYIRSVPRLICGTGATLPEAPDAYPREGRIVARSVLGGLINGYCRLALYPTAFREDYLYILLPKEIQRARGKDLPVHPFSVTEH